MKNKSNVPPLSVKHLAPHELLKRALDRMKRKNPAYSMRALARAAGVSPSYLSRIVKGVKPIPLARFEKLTSALAMDETSCRILRESITRKVLSKAALLGELNSVLREKGEVVASRLTPYDEGALTEYSLLEPWYRIALLDLVTCENFQPSPHWIAARLGISASEADVSFKALKEHGFITEKDGRWTKRSEKLRFPTVKSNPTVRRYHQQMINKALKMLLTETDDASFARRSITAVSFAANPENIAKAKQRLTEALYEIAEILTDGNCTEVYQLNAQLFSLTPKVRNT